MNWGKFWQEAGAWLTDEGLKILWTLVVGAVIYYFAGPVIHWLMRHIAKGIHSKTPRSEIRKRQKTLAGLFITIAHVMVVLVVIFTILSGTGLNLAPLLASAGIAGIALGFGAQSLVRDSIAGFFIILENQYRVGDYIEITGTGISNAHGAVEKVSIRSTILRDRDGNVHFVPNGSVTQVINKTLGYSKVHFTFVIAKSSDVEQVTTVIDELGRKLSKEKTWTDKIIDPPHFVEVGKFDSAGVEVTVSGMTGPADQWVVTSEFKKRLMAALEKAKIEVV
jgi:small conductance mechanosensitive channel